MRRYTTLGTGEATKVLAVTDYHPARTITTCTLETATAVCRALGHTDRELAAALYPLAVHLDGQPVEARRHLLGVFDDVAAAGPQLDPTLETRGVTEPGTPWTPATVLVIRLARAVAGAPVAAVELRPRRLDRADRFRLGLRPRCPRRPRFDR